MSNEWGEFSWGPEKQSRPDVGPIVTLAMAGAIVVLLVAAGMGVAIHHSKSKAAFTPPNYQRLVDSIDHISLAVPNEWRALALSTGQLSNNINALKASNPQLAPLLDLAQQGLRLVQPGVFAIDVNTRTSLFSYGVPAGGITKLSDIPTSQVTGPLIGAGAKKVTANQIQLPVGLAERVSAQLLVGTVTVTELLDYFVLHGRVVAIVLAARSADPPTALFHQIERTLTSA